MTENWKQMPNFPDYIISDHGRVKGPMNKILKPSVSKNYLRVSLYKKRKASMVFIHRCVLAAFVGPPKIGQVSCHNDGNRQNNHVSNLRWDSSKANSADQIKHGTQVRGELISTSKLNAEKIKQIRAAYKYFMDHLAEQYGVNKVTIISCINRKTWNHI